MKKVVAVSLVVALAFLAGRFSRQLPVEAQEGGDDAAHVCADANADGAFDISDPVYLLQFLFSGGPAPVCPEPRVVGLPDTGQTLCSAEVGVLGGMVWAAIPCVTPAWPGEDGPYDTGCPVEGRFVDNGNGTITDNCTGLMWQQDTADVNGDDTRGEGDRLPWTLALVHCDNLVFAEYDDWRLPNVRELQSIVDYGEHGPSIDPAFGARPGRYWSSTTVSPEPAFTLSSAWYVSFSSGEVSGELKGSFSEPDGVPLLVRAVRTIQPGE